MLPLSGYRFIYLFVCLFIYLFIFQSSMLYINQSEISLGQVYYCFFPFYFIKLTLKYTLKQISIFCKLIYLSIYLSIYLNSVFFWHFMYVSQQVCGIC